MRKLYHILSLVTLLTAFSCDAQTYWPRKAFYQYQLGAVFGLNITSVGTEQVHGTHWGIYSRIDRHTFGFRQEWDGEFVKLSGDPLYYRRSGFYYGWTQAGRHLHWGPQIGFGLMDKSRPDIREIPIAMESGVYGEIAVHGFANVCGTGIGGKVYLNINRFVPILGGTIYFQAGWAWNKKAAKSQAKMGASPSVPTF